LDNRGCSALRAEVSGSLLTPFSRAKMRFAITQWRNLRLSIGFDEPNQQDYRSNCDRYESQRDQ